MFEKENQNELFQLTNVFLSKVLNEILNKIFQLMNVLNVFINSEQSYTCVSFFNSINVVIELYIKSEIILYNKSIFIHICTTNIQSYKTFDNRGNFSIKIIFSGKFLNCICFK